MPPNCGSTSSSPTRGTCRTRRRYAVRRTRSARHLVIADIADDHHDLHHDPAKLAKIYREIFE